MGSNHMTSLIYILIYLKYTGSAPCFTFNLQREITFVNSVCFPGRGSPSKIESILKGKNLLLEEQILSFKSRFNLEKGHK